MARRKIVPARGAAFVVSAALLCVPFLYTSAFAQGMAPGTDIFSNDPSHRAGHGINIHRIASGRKAARPGGVRRTGLPLPRYASLRAAKVNLRAGPGVRYPVEWVYQRRGLPVKITAEFDAWRKIRDWRGTVGWIHRSMLSGKRTVITTSKDVVLHRAPSKTSPAIARAEAGVIARVLACEAGWCRIEAGGIAGWGERRELWGTLGEEKIK